MLDAGKAWWDPSWSSWKPDPEWVALALPDGWDHAEPVEGSSPQMTFTLAVTCSGKNN